jgi:Flp pilus assembly protein TadD
MGGQQQNFALAAATYSGCMMNRPDQVRLYFGRGWAYVNLRRFEEAEADARQLMRQRPDFPVTHVMLNAALRGQENYAEAEAECREALRLRPDFPEARVHLAMTLANRRFLRLWQLRWRIARPRP